MITRERFDRVVPMELKCEYSRLTIPNDSGYAPIVAKYAEEIARKIGFGDQEIEMIGRGVEKAVLNQMGYSFDPDERANLEVSCERVPEGLKVVIKDSGMPFDPNRIFWRGDSQTESREGSKPELEISDLREYMDEVLFRNLGPEGKETVLIKHLKRKNIVDYYEACDLTPYQSPTDHKLPVSEKDECIVRPMKPSEAIEVSKCIYRAYGYSYAYEHVYYPERLLELNKSGRMHSAVATTKEGEIVGHCALTYWQDHGRVAEMTQGVVRPEYRYRGCFSKLTGYLVDKARSDGLMGIFDKPVTIHMLSQRVSHRFGLKDCALILGYIPTSVHFKGIAENLSERVSVLVHFMYLYRPAQLVIYPPLEHREMILKLYQNLGITPETETPEDSATENLQVNPLVEIKIISSMSFALIEIVSYGRNIVSEIRARLKELCLKKIEIINLYLNLGSPAMTGVVKEIERLGFFFAGILPGGVSGGDALILQYLNNVSIDYSKIVVSSKIAEEMTFYIARHDPNRV
jgi:anti-sigma regulatory factor (Ser/Thr protein kinase)